MFFYIGPLIQTTVYNRELLNLVYHYADIIALLLRTQNFKCVLYYWMLHLHFLIEDYQIWYTYIMVSQLKCTLLNCGPAWKSTVFDWESSKFDILLILRT